MLCVAFKYLFLKHAVLVVVDLDKNDVAPLAFWDIDVDNKIQDVHLLSEAQS
jgi:hypothetical protein